jgi:rhomboid protease GluP
MMCGATTAGPAPAAPRVTDGEVAVNHPDPETRRFVHAFISRPAPFTFVFLTACVFLFLLTVASGLDQNSTAVLQVYGAKVNYLIREQREWWRFVTPIFLHGSWIHLIVNMYGLFMLGPYVEKLYGSAKFTVIWVLTGVGGTVASYFAVQPDHAEGLLGRFLLRAVDAPSVGASGALFGLVGVLFVFGIKFRRELPDGFKRAFGTGMLPMIAINLFIGFTIPFIDNAAHLGGLVTGAALALLVDYKRPGPRGPVDFAWHAAQGAALAAVVVSFGMVTRNFESPSAPVQAPVVVEDTGPSPARLYIDATREAQRIVVAAINNTPADRAAADGVIEQLDAVPPLSLRADALREEMKALVVRARDLEPAPLRTSRTRAEGRARQARERERIRLNEDFKVWGARFGDWLGTEAEIFGLKPAAAAGGGEEPSPGAGAK